MPGDKVAGCWSLVAGKRFLTPFLSLFFFASPVFAVEYAIGADLSFLRQAEGAGTVFKDGNQAALKLRESGPFGSSVVLMEDDVEKEK